MPSLSFWLAYLAFGVVAGIIAGLLGVGGGIVVVPALYWLFTAQGLPHERIGRMLAWDRAIGQMMAAPLRSSTKRL